MRRCRLGTRCALVGLDPFCPENESLLTSFDIPGLHAMLNHLEKKGPLVVSEVALALEGNFMGFYEGRNTPGDRRIAQWAETVAGAPLYEMLVEEAAKILSLQGPSIQIIKQVGRRGWSALVIQ